jgi:uncharacterized membrane protein YphA (DoxX/SURF4 family)
MTAGLLRSRPWALTALAAAICAQIVWIAFAVRAGQTSVDYQLRPVLFTGVMALVLLTGGRASVPVLLARFTVAGAFLNALWSRFGNFGGFLKYAAQVNAFMPADTIPFLAISATVLEVAFCAALVLGIALRWAALGSAVLLFLFATAMTLSRLDQFEWAVYVLSMGAWVVSASDAPYVLSVDHWRADRRDRIGSGTVSPIS